MYEQITLEVQDPVALITLNRPERLNAWTTTMAAEMRDAVGRACDDPAVVGVVITGAGRAFCAGIDLDTLGIAAEGDPADAPTIDDLAGRHAMPSATETGGDFDGGFTYLMATTKPIIAAINGPVVGMAYVLALCCDIRFVTEDAIFLTAFAQLGLIGEWGMAWLLPRLVGTGAALDLMYSSRKVDGVEAVHLGLANKVVPADQLVDDACQYVRDLAEGSSPSSMAIMKRQVYERLHAGLGPAERDAHDLMVESFTRPDAPEGIRSFREKRPPKFARLHGPV